MNNLLIVDDMPVIVDGLADLFSGKAELELEIFRAYTVFEALDILKHQQIDIVFTDIKMPVKTGIDLLKEIRAQWPRCKVIFLTCYDDFNYAKEAVSLGGFDYILKTEGDDRILYSIKKAIEAIKSEHDAEYLVNKSRELYNQAKPVLQKEYIIELLEGRRPSADIRNERFSQLGISLDADYPVYLILMRLDDGKKMESHNEWLRRFYSIQTIMEDNMGSMINFLPISYNSFDHIWFVQPAVLNDFWIKGWEEIFRFVYGKLELVQNMCLSHLQLRVSFMVSARPVNWNELPEAFPRLQLLFKSGISLNSGILTTDVDLQKYNARQSTLWSSHGLKQKEFRLNRFSNLSEHLNNGQEEDFFVLFKEMMEAVAVHEESIGTRLEVYHYLSSVFLSNMNRWNIMNEVSRQMDTNLLTSFDAQNPWQIYAEYFSRLARLLFKFRVVDQDEQTNKVVTDVQEYIRNNLHSDLSLTQLGSQVHLNSSYLSRLYKQITDISLSDYITEQRIRKARELLCRNDLKIHEISQALGYNSGTAFTRFFKKVVGVTPQEFRDGNYHD